MGCPRSCGGLRSWKPSVPRAGQLLQSAGPGRSYDPNFSPSFLLYNPCLLGGGSSGTPCGRAGTAQTTPRLQADTFGWPPWPRGLGIHPSLGAACTSPHPSLKQLGQVAACEGLSRMFEGNSQGIFWVFTWSLQLRTRRAAPLALGPYRPGSTAVGLQ